jgi:hypothetical protein
MRTTLTLDPDVAKLIEDAVHRERRPTKQVINEALRRGLTPPARRDIEPYRLAPHHAAVRPGFDLAHLNRLVDDWDTDAFIDKARGAE